MVTCVTHSRNLADEVILHHLDQHLQSLTTNQKAALAIAALYTASKPKDTSVYINSDGGGKFQSAIELLLQLSTQGLLALTRAMAARSDCPSVACGADIAEELAVLEHLLEVKK